MTENTKQPEALIDGKLQFAVKAAIQDFLGLAQDAEAEAVRALDLIDDDTGSAIDSINLCIEQAEEVAAAGRRALRVIERERAK